MPTSDKPSDTTLAAPSWDTSPNTLPEYAIDLCEWLERLDPHYVTLVQQGYILDRHGNVICVSDNHCDRLRAGLVPLGTFQKPTIVAPDDYSAEGLPVLTAEERAADDASADKKRHSSNPQLVGQYHTRMLNHIESTISDRDTVKDLRKECNGSGPALLAIFEARRAAKASDSLGTA